MFTTNFPTSLDALTNPTGGQSLVAVDHAAQHANANDAIEALEAKMGVNGSAVNTTIDYKLSGVATGDKAVSKTGTETLTNKTLTAPIINIGSDATGDMYYRKSDGTFARLAIGTVTQILNVDVSGIPAWITNPSAADATYLIKGISYKLANSEYYAADAGANDTYAITLSPALNAYVTGQEFSFKANTANTGPATLNINGLGAKTIVKYVNTALADGDIAAGMICTVRYDGTNFALQNPIANIIINPVEQEIPYISSSTTGNVTTLNFTSSTDGSVAFMTYGSTLQYTILRLVKNTLTGQYSITHSTQLNAVSSISSISIACTSTNLYFFYTDNAAQAVRRYDLADLANVTTITVSGTTFAGGGSFSNGTDVYVYASANTFNKYTISGTTMTFSSAITYTSAGTFGANPNDSTAICDGTSVYIANGVNFPVVIKKYALAGGASIASLTRYIQQGAYPRASGPGLFMSTNSLVGFAFAFGIDSASAVVGGVLKLSTLSTI